MLGMISKRLFSKVVALVVFTVSAWGEQEELDLLDPLIVTGTRTALAPGEVPFTSSIIDHDEINDASFRSFPEVFRQTPGVMVQKTAHGQGSPYVRGFTGFRNLLLIDGIRLNHSAFRDGPNQYWNTIDPYMIDQLEVVKGQGSVLFGSDAIGGTVNARTRGPNIDDYVDGEHFVDGRALYRWSSGENSHIGRIEVATGEGGKAGFYLGYSQKQFGNLRVAELGELSHTGYDEWDLDTKFVYKLNPDTQWTVAYQRVQQNNVPRTHRTLYAKSWEGTTVGNEQRRELDQDRHLAYTQLEIDTPFAGVDRAQISLSWQRHEETRDRIRRIGDDRRDIQGFTLDTLGFWGQMESETTLGDFTYGFSYYRDWVDSFADRYNGDGSFAGSRSQGPVGDDATYDLAGIYVQDRISLTGNIDLWLGARGTYARADIGTVADPVTGDRTSIEDDWFDFSASARLLWKPFEDDHLQVYGGVSQGFRAPNLSDLSRLDSARSNEIETPSPGLDPEEFINYEIGFRIEPNDTFAAGLTYFYTDLSDTIVRTPTGREIDGDQEVIKKNAGDGYVHGIEFESSWEFQPGWTLFGNVTWLDGKVDTFPTSAPETSREPLSRMMPLTGLLGLRWDPNERVWLEIAGQFADRQDDLSSRDKSDTQRIPPGGTPSYAVVSLRGGWHVNDNLTLRMALENLTDEDYRIHGSGQNEVGFSGIVSAEVTF